MPDDRFQGCLERLVSRPCPEKRSPALRGYNLTRDIRFDGAPTLQRVTAEETDSVPFLFVTLATVAGPQ
jgi:hypothetical protein